MKPVFYIVPVVSLICGVILLNTSAIVGVSSNAMEFNLDYYVANSNKEQRDQFFDRVLAYVSKLIK
uniref:hypothetical protein n=1 Tax=Agathobacter sp. TaxID=2021311 RepID=UPI004056C8E4